MTSSTGTVTGTYTYSPYGETTATGTGSTPFDYTGRENDGASGLYYYRARYYSPALGRFISEDPIGLRGGGLNFYAYASGNPISRTDPLGLWSFKLEGYAGLGGAIIFGQDPTTGNWFYGGRLGIGIGGGFSVDPLGKRPGAETGGCGASTTVGSFGDFGESVDGLQLPIEQFGGGVNLQTGKSYSEGPSLFGTASGGSGGHRGDVCAVGGRY